MMENKNLAPHEPVVREGGPTPSNATAEPSAAFTPAPWVIIPPRPYDGDDPELEGSYEMLGGIEGADGNPVCVFGSHEGSGCMFENPANAPLIAAAPDLLGALKGAMAAINAAIQLGMAEAQGHERTAAKLDAQIEAARAQARAAIAKATGAGE